jgi:hypothetical protein
MSEIWSRRIGRMSAGEIRQSSAVARAVTDQQRLHQADALAPVLCHINVRMKVRFYVRFKVASTPEIQGSWGQEKSRSSYLST